jgi:hypothetical protein
VTSHTDGTPRRNRVDELLLQIDAQRRQQLLLEVSGAYSPGLEREAEETRRQLAELVS